MTTADNQPLGQALAENQAFLQTMFGGSSDFYTKSFTICGCRCCIAMFAGLSSPEKLCIMVLHALGQGVPGCKAGPQLVQYLILLYKNTETFINFDFRNQLLFRSMYM